MGLQTSHFGVQAHVQCNVCFLRLGVHGSEFETVTLIQDTMKNHRKSAETTAVQKKLLKAFQDVSKAGYLHHASYNP